MCDKNHTYGKTEVTFPKYKTFEVGGDFFNIQVADKKSALSAV